MLPHQDQNQEFRTWIVKYEPLIRGHISIDQLANGRHPFCHHLFLLGRIGLDLLQRKDCFTSVPFAFNCLSSKSKRFIMSLHYK